MKQNEPTMIVSSKYFLQYLKQVKALHPCWNKDEDLPFELMNGELKTEFKSMPVEHKGNVSFEISKKSIKCTIKVLKAISHQPIKVSFVDNWSCFKLEICS